tara:strand:+ start:25188 stop:27047 length:1860 start_codon:yes stop_codon:yes gene_type:complete
MSKMNNSFMDEQQTEVSDYTFLSASDKPKKLLVTVDASHAGYKNKNGFWYDSNSMKYAVGQDAWTKPFPKPFLKNHDLEGEPIGRVQAARFIDTQDGKGYTQLDIQVTDSDAIEKIMDGRYLTVSTHGIPMQSAESSYNFVLCSVCNVNLNTEEFCGHSRGHIYENEDGNDVQCFWKVGALDYKEVSIVNNPADNDGATAAQISGVSMVDGEEPIIADTLDDTPNTSMLVFSDSAVTYADNLEFKEAEIANLVLWESVGQDKQQYIDNKGLLFNRCDDLEDDSKAGYSPNCNNCRKKVKGTKKCVAKSGKSTAKNYDAEKDIQAPEVKTENSLIKAIEEFNNEDKHEEHTMNLKEETINRLKKVLEGADAEKIKELKLLVSSSEKANDELKAAFLEVFEGTDASESEEKNESEEVKEVSPEDLAEVMTVEGVKEYLELVKQESYSQGYEEASLSLSVEIENSDKESEDHTEDTEAEATEAEATEAEAPKESAKDSEKEEDSEKEKNNAEVDDIRKEIRDVLVDSIVKHATALRKSEIDMDRIAESQKEYKESLSDKKEEELQEIYKDLSKSMLNSFENIPSESLKSETTSEDSPEGSDSENPDALSDAQKVMNKYFNQA